MIDYSWAANHWAWVLTFKRVPVSDAEAKPILFSGPMVRAIMEGSKTQTRRVVKPVRGFGRNNICKPDMAADPWAVWWHGDETDRVGCLQECPFGRPGEFLWVRETFTVYSTDTGSASVARRERMPPGKTLADTDGGLEIFRISRDDWNWANLQTDPDHWKPSIFMPRWACRIMLELTDVRVQRLQEISEEDARAEGALLCDEVTGRVSLDDRRGSYRLGFHALWDSINGNRKAKAAA